jgi:VanZ like protein
MLQHKRAGTVIAASGLLLIAVLTLTPDFAAGRHEPSLCLICGQRGGEDAFLNVLLFMPFGFGLRLRGTKRWLAWSVALAITVTVETLQIYIPGRDSTLSDVVTNALGGLAGILICDSRRIWLLPGVRQSRWLLLSGSAVWLLLVALGGWAMRPWMPEGRYVVQIAPDLDQIELFEGRVLDARVNGMMIVPNAPLAHSDAMRDSVLRGTLILQARILPAAPTYDLAPIVSIASSEDAEVVVLGQGWRDAVFRVRLHSGELRMNIPEVVAERVFPPASATSRDTLGDTTELQGEIVDGKRLIVSYATQAKRRTAELTLDPFLLWSLVTPGERRSPAAFAVVSMLWVGMLLAPLGYWAGRWKLQARMAADFRGVGVRPEILLTASTVAGLAGVPWIFGFPIARSQLWIAAAIAIVVAFRLAREWST